MGVHRTLPLLRYLPEPCEGALIVSLGRAWVGLSPLPTQAGPVGLAQAVRHPSPRRYHPLMSQLSPLAPHPRTRITPFLYRVNTLGLDSAIHAGSIDRMSAASFSTTSPRVYRRIFAPAQRRILDAIDRHNALHVHSHSRAITRGSPKSKMLPLLALLPHLTYVLMSSQLLPVRTRIVPHCFSGEWASSPPRRLRRHEAQEPGASGGESLSALAEEELNLI